VWHESSERGWLIFRILTCRQRNLYYFLGLLAATGQLCWLERWIQASYRGGVAVRHVRLHHEGVMKNACLWIPILLLTMACSIPGHRVLTQGNGNLAIVDRNGVVTWHMPWGGIHDLHVLPSGNIMVQRGSASVVEIDKETKAIVWEYDSATRNGNRGKRVEVHAFEPLPNGNVMIAESGPARIIEVDRDGVLLCETKLTVDRPHPHMDTRLVRVVGAKHYLVCHEGDGVVREYERGSGRVVWEYDVPMFGQESRGGHGLDAFGDKCFCALRLGNGNTLISTGNGHSVIEVTPGKEVVWRLAQDDLEGIRFAWVTTIEVLPNGNYVIGNCHAGPSQPLLVEIEPASKRVVWTFDEFEAFGNSVPNSQLLDVQARYR
jgi:outer membrane protein assembly factor BamB